MNKVYLIGRVTRDVEPKYFGVKEMMNDVCKIHLSS